MPNNVRVLGFDDTCGGTPDTATNTPAALIDMVEGRSKRVFKQWLAEPERSWREVVEVEAMDGFAGFKTATAEELPAVAVLAPFHIVRLAGDALDRCRRRVQQYSHGHRGRTGDPLYRRAGSCTPAQTCSPTNNCNG